MYTTQLTTTSAILSPFYSWMSLFVSVTTVALLPVLLCVSWHRALEAHVSLKFVLRCVLAILAQQCARRPCVLTVLVVQPQVALLNAPKGA